MNTVPPLAQMIEELDRALVAVVNEGDREFIEGIKILMEMQEPIAQDAIQRVAKIYIKFQQDMHSAL